MTTLLAALASAALAAGLILILMPLMRRYALARPNARSSHREPTPQGGGAAVVAAALVVSGAALAAGAGPSGAFGAVAAATLALAVLGGVDDVRPLPVAPRLAAQGACALAAVLAAGPLGWPVPAALEIAVLALAVAWFVNLTNFMDGLDWLTVAGFVPATATLAAFGAAGVLPPEPALVAAALCGALLGFAPFNKPVARLFLGDVGSLPIGLLCAWLLLSLAAAGHLAAALILPLYHCADATITLARRAAAGERIWEAHRSHFYQRATDNGLSVAQVSGTALALNVALALLATASVAFPSPALDAAALGLAALLVGATLAWFARPQGARRRA